MSGSNWNKVLSPIRCVGGTPFKFLKNGCHRLLTKKFSQYEFSLLRKSQTIMGEFLHPKLKVKLAPNALAEGAF